ncbi:MAG: pseudouridine synthase [Acidobacteriota bacterium]
MSRTSSRSAAASSVVSPVPPSAADLEVIHRDDVLVAIAKPSGLAVHRGAARDPVYALELVRDRVGAYVYPVHRLDRPTSGVLLFALDRDVAGACGKAFAEGRIDKRYLALVRGVPPEQVILDKPLREIVDRRGRSQDRPAADPRPARTELRRLAVFEDRYALVEVRPRTGRRHQIRRHLKGASWPILGDVRYGKGEHNRLFRRRFGLHRLALHALALSLTHPISQKQLMLRAPPPPDLARPLAAMGFNDVLRLSSVRSTSRATLPS